MVVTLSAFAFYWYAYPALKMRPITFTVKREDFTVKITEIGELRALKSVTILAQKDGPIAYLKPEGSIVKRGDVLVRFDSSEFEVLLSASRVEVLAAEAGLEGARKNLDATRELLLSERGRLESEFRMDEVDLENLKRLPLPIDLEAARLGVKRARIQVEHAEKKLEVLPELVEKGFVTRSALDDARTNYLVAEGALQAAQLQFRKVAAGAKPEQLEKARIRLEQAKSAIERAEGVMGPKLQVLEAVVVQHQANVARAKNMIEKAEAKLAKTVIRAPQSGLVVYAESTGGLIPGTGKIRLGTMAFAGQPLLYIPDISKMGVEIEVNEVDIRKVKIGQRAEMILDAYPNALFHGRVLEIGRLARRKRTPSPFATNSKVKIFSIKNTSS